MTKWKALLEKPWLLPDKVMAYLMTKLRRRMALSTDSFGWLQAILYPGIDQWQRYASVAQQVRMLDERPISILDVGGVMVILRNS